MRKRGVRIQVWLNQEENKRLQANVEKTGLTKESYLRTLINGYVPKERPHPDYFNLMRELHAIGNNLNQLAAKANTTSHIDKAVFMYEANQLRKAILDIQSAFTTPERRSNNGNNGDMGCHRPA